MYTHFRNTAISHVHFFQPYTASTFSFSLVLYASISSHDSDDDDEKLHCMMRRGKFVCVCKCVMVFKALSINACMYEIQKR